MQTFSRIFWVKPWRLLVGHVEKKTFVRKTLSKEMKKSWKNFAHEDAFAYLITMEMQIRWFEFDSSSSYILLNTNHERV